MSLKEKASPMELWGFRRRQILKQMDEKMIPIGHIYELPRIEDTEEESPFEGLASEEQYQLLLNAFKNCCLGYYDSKLYPYHDDNKLERIKFKVPKKMNRDVKDSLRKLTKMLRCIIIIRVKCSELLFEKTCGLVVRSVAEMIRDFLQSEFPVIFENVLIKAQYSFSKIDNVSQNLQTDLEILASTLERIKKAELIGGIVISYLNRSEIHQLSDSQSFIPQLFQRCITAGMKHYNQFLEEFMYKGFPTSDKQHEFCVWDLGVSKVFKASDFLTNLDSNLAFDNRFVFIPELVPSVWKPRMVKTAFHTRRLISILVAETRKPFTLPYSPISTMTPEQQHVVISDACKLVGAALLQEINKVFNVQEFNSLLYDMIFNPSNLWMADFVFDIENLANNVTLDDSYVGTFDEYFKCFFYDRMEAVKSSFLLVSIALFNNTLFECKSPNETRLIDMIESINMSEDTPDEGDCYGNEENQPINPCVEDYDPHHGKQPQQQLEDPKHSAPESTPLPVVQKIGIQFSSYNLFKCLLPLSTQENINRLFRLKFALTRANSQLLQKRFLNKGITAAEQIFIAFVQGFINRYTSFVFGTLTEDNWKLFEDALPTLKSIDDITEAQKLLLRNINSAAGLFTGKNGFSGGLQRIIDIIADYSYGQFDFNEAADYFFETYKHIRATVCNKDDQHVERMSYEVFRVPHLVRMKDVEMVEIDPRNGLEPQRNLATFNPNIRRSISSMNVHRR